MSSKLMNSLGGGNIVAIPTEAVYGLSCDPGNDEAIQALLQLKRRPKEKGLILVAAKVEQLEPYVDWSKLSDEQVQKVQASWPGPVTWIVPAKSSVSEWLTGGSGNIAVRVTAHEPMRQASLTFGGALVSTSANVAGEAPATSLEQLSSELLEKVAGVWPGELGGASQPSHIFEACTNLQLR